MSWSLWQCDGLQANVTRNGTSWLVCIVQNTAGDFMGQQVITSRSYSTEKTAKLGAHRLLEKLGS